MTTARRGTVIGVAALGVMAITAALHASGMAAQDWPSVIAQLRDGSSGRRMDALRKLRDAAYVPAIEYVAPLVTDPDDTVQLEAIDTELTFFLLDPAAGHRSGGSTSLAQAAFDAGPLARTASAAPAVLVDQLIAATADRNPRVRFDALHAVGVIAEAPLGNEETRRLIAGLQHGDPVVRTATARVLGRLRATAAGDALVDALNDASEMVQQYATEALGLVRNDRAVQALTDRVNYYRKGAQVDAALLALARIAHPSSRDLFRARLSDPEPAARRAAVEGLGRLRDTASLERVRALEKSDSSSDVRLAGLFALDRMGEPQLAGILLSLSQPVIGTQAREYLLEAGPAAAPAIKAALVKPADPATRVPLIQLLGYVGGAADAAAIDPLTRDADARTARAAANAVLRLRR
jgi:HEAT repeat protein